MTPRLYLETTIIGYLTSSPSRDIIVAAHQQITKEWWKTRRDAFELFVSQFVMDEAAAGDSEAARERLDVLQSIPLLDVTQGVLDLASTIIQSGIIPEKASRDAAHIAVCAVHGIDYLMTWNCAHLANATIIKRIQAICVDAGLSYPVICTPEELIAV